MFITLEGIEGAGKTTIMNMLAQWLVACGLNPLLTREPGGSQLGRSLRSILLDCRTGSICSEAELFLFLADRAQHINEIINPALEAGQPVLCDRYVDSTIAYQGYGRGKDIKWLRQICTTACGRMPDLTLLLALPTATGLARAGKRNCQEGTVISEGRFEAESQKFHERVARGYLELAKNSPDRIVIIDAAGQPEQVLAACQNVIKDRFGACL